jgi:predicted DNA-binding protein
MKKTSVYLTEDEAERLRALAVSSGRSQAELVREALGALLDQTAERSFRSMARGESSALLPRRWDAEDLAARRLGRR